MKGYTPSILLIISIPTILLCSQYLNNLFTSVIVLSFATAILYTLSWTVEEKGTTLVMKGDSK